MQKYFISILIMAFSFVALGQEKELPQRQVFIRAGVDLSRFILPYVNDVEVSGFEVSLDTEVKYNFFPTVEFGMNNINHQTTDFDYTADGSYFRVGLDYNMLKYQHRLDRNIFYIGARYAYSNYHQQANNVILENEWGAYETSFTNENLNQHWGEAIMGLRGEILKNFYMGFSVRIKFKLAGSDINNLSPYFIPGYGKSGNNVNTGLSYSIFYAIPIKRIK